MATPTTGEPFSEAAGEAVQSAVMAMRLAMAIADAVRRHQQRRQKGKEEELPPAAQAVSEATGDVGRLLPSDICAALMREADWPHLAQQLVALRGAGVDLEHLLPRIGEIAVHVRDQVAAKAQEAAGGQWERVVRDALPAGPVREAILTSPAWPQMAATMARLDGRGVNVRQVLAAAHHEALGVDQAVAKGLGAAAEGAMSRDAVLSYGPLTTGLDLPRDLDLSDRERVLKQLAISPQENARYARWVREALPGREREADALVHARHWPLIAARMAQLESRNQPVRERLARLMVDTSWQDGPPYQRGERLVQAAGEALLGPVGGAPASSRVGVSGAARSRSTTAGPVRPQGNGPAPATPKTLRPRSLSEPAPRRGRSR